MRARLRALLRLALRRIESGPAGVPSRLAIAQLKSSVRALIDVGTLPRRFLVRIAPRRAADHLFDAAFYTATYPDVAGSDLAPIEHYRLVGALERRTPNPIVDVAAYEYDNPDVTAFGGDILMHYVRVGRLRGATLHPLFDPAWYRANNPDVGSRDPYEHYLHKGRAEGRAPSAAVGTDVGGVVPRPVLQSIDPDEARITVIIPAYRQAALTVRCLDSLARHTNWSLGVRVVVADDDPEHPLGPLLADIDGVEVITNETNLGFLRNCNLAARSATGEFVVFLNNDTVVLDGWLDALVRAAERDATIAIVGCKLVQPNGSLEEAGTVMFRDGWGYPYGRGDQPDLPRYSYLREVDAVTGACFLIRREAWEAAGGFDDAYAPAFFEEYELAFRVAELGWKVVYQPAARVLHSRNASYGPAVRDRQSIINHRRFVQRWGEELATRHDGLEELFLARERPHARGTILVIDDKVPEYDRHAGALGTYQYLALMVEEDFKVIFLADDGIARQPYTDTLQELGIEVITGPLAIANWLKEVGPHLRWVILSRPWVAPRYLYHVREQSNARVLYHPQDLYWLRERRRYQVTGDAEAMRESARLYRIEQEIFRRVDCGLTLSVDEVPLIEAMAPGTEIRVVTPYFYEQGPATPSRHPPLTDRSEIVFVGAYDHLPNVDAATVLIREVMPLVWKQRPDAHVLLVGDFAPPEIEALASDRVSVLGYVPDLATVWARARMSVNPIRFGAGVKGKVVHSLQAGVPVITTTIGNEGIRLRPGLEVLIGDTPEAIAEHVISLYDNPELLMALAAAGSRLINDRYTKGRARSDLFAALRIAGGDGGDSAV